jgi:signal transduction histidine kinase
MSTNREPSYTVIALKTLKVKSKYVSFLKFWLTIALILTMMHVILVKKICHRKTRQMIYQNKELLESQFSSKQA